MQRHAAPCSVIPGHDESPNNVQPSGNDTKTDIYAHTLATRNVPRQRTIRGQWLNGWHDTGDYCFIATSPCDRSCTALLLANRLISVVCCSRRYHACRVRPCTSQRKAAEELIFCTKPKRPPPLRVDPASKKQRFRPMGGTTYLK